MFKAQRKALIRITLAGLDKVYLIDGLCSYLFLSALSLEVPRSFSLGIAIIS
jgi:hypothetical protein